MRRRRRARRGRRGRGCSPRSPTDKCGEHARARLAVVRARDRRLAADRPAHLPARRRDRARRPACRRSGRRLAIAAIARRRSARSRARSPACSPASPASRSRSPAERATRGLRWRCRPARPILVLSLAFPTGGEQPFPFSTFCRDPAARRRRALAGPARAARPADRGRCSTRRSRLLVFVVPTPIGSNVVRLGALFAGPVAGAGAVPRRPLVLAAGRASAALLAAVRPGPRPRQGGRRPGDRARLLRAAARRARPAPGRRAASGFRSRRPRTAGRRPTSRPSSRSPAAGCASSSPTTSSSSPTATSPRPPTATGSTSTPSPTSPSPTPSSTTSPRRGGADRGRASLSRPGLVGRALAPVPGPRRPNRSG